MATTQEKVMTSLPEESSALMKVLQDVQGDEGLLNNVLLYFGEKIHQHILFFQGDVQDLLENMMSHRDNHRWKEYCLENTAKLLYEKFDNACVWIIRPKRMHLKTFSSYDNFVKSNMFGVPEYCDDGMHASIHLSNIFKNISNEATTQSCFPLTDVPVTLIGFSKGCAVLNQILHELPCLLQHKNNPTYEFMKQITTFIWLDSGNCGSSGAWVTQENLLESASSFLPSIQIHVTPYQLTDTQKPWIRKEKEKFVKLLKGNKCKLTEYSYFDGKQSTLEDHFRLLKVFNPDRMD